VGDFNVNGRVRGQPPDVDSQEYLDLLEDFQSNDYAMYDLLKLDAGCTLHLASLHSPCTWSDNQVVN